jgi:hypothetical protein
MRATIIHGDADKESPSFLIATKSKDPLPHDAGRSLEISD